MSIQLIQQYYTKVEKLIQYSGTRNESTLRKAFQDLLEQYARSKNLLLVPEVEFVTKKGHKIYPDGTLKDALRQDWGYWESKDEKDNLNQEIQSKFAKGYPTFNILFEDTRTAILFQCGEEVMRADFTDAKSFDALLTRFVSYESPEVRGFHKAIEQFSADVPQLAETLRTIIEEQFHSNPSFEKGAEDLLEHCKKAINPDIVMADIREMVIQHILTEDIFMRVFDEAEFHRENNIAIKLSELTNTFYSGSMKRNIDSRIAHYYETINAKASQISDHHEKQKFLKALYEKFYQSYNPKAADRLGVIYTPEEIVNFMIESTDYLLFKHFNKTLGDPYIEILDPATGTGTFITELIEYLPLNQLDEKYENDIHCNEVAILPYYIANLNIEYTYKQKTGKYKEFENICFVDTLDNTGFSKTHDHQMDFFGLWDENAERIGRQNTKKISVIIGNPPYNANQKNENENNKNREYPIIDKRIKETYIKHSTAQKTKLYDMYVRFLRWSSDRLAQNGIIAFVSNNSFIDARSFDGFRKVVADEFSDIYIINLKGDARTSGERRRKEGGNVFSDQIRVGVAIYFLVKTKGRKGCQIHYNEIEDYITAEGKKSYLRESNLRELPFIKVHPDVKHNWLNISQNEWYEFLPISSKKIKSRLPKKDLPFAFIHYSNGVNTARDEWVIDVNEQSLLEKIKYLVSVYNKQLTQKTLLISDLNNNLDYSIKWSDALKRNLLAHKSFSISPQKIVNYSYRPFFKVFYYAEKNLSDRLTANHYLFFGKELRKPNLLISMNSSSHHFTVLASNHLTDWHFTGDTTSFPLYTFDEMGDKKDNLSDSFLNVIHKKYRDKSITKLSVFHYIYSILHNPSYQVKFKNNLARDFPRITFYENFWQWSEWGKTLMDLHINYEQVQPYPLKREDIDPETIRKAVVPRLLARKDTGKIEVDTLTTLTGVPPEVWDYRLGTYSAVEWVLERYKEKTPKDPTIREKFNTYKFADYKEQVIDLICRVCTVSMETMKIINEMVNEKK